MVNEEIERKLQLGQDYFDAQLKNSNIKLPVITEYPKFTAAQDKPRLISVELMGGRRMFIVENRNINNETY